MTLQEPPNDMRQSLPTALEAIDNLNHLVQTLMRERGDKKAACMTLMVRPDGYRITVSADESIDEQALAKHALGRFARITDLLTARLTKLKEVEELLGQVLGQGSQEIGDEAWLRVQKALTLVEDLQEAPGADKED